MPSDAPSPDIPGPPPPPTGILRWIRHAQYFLRTLSPEEHVRHERHLADTLRTREMQQCRDWRNDLVKTSPVVRFMLAECKKAGCEVDVERDIQCGECDWTRSGGFMPPLPQVLQQDVSAAPAAPTAPLASHPCTAPSESVPGGGILLCANRLVSRTHAEDTLAHELIHLHDHCKFNVDWSDPRHHACSEIRAASLSGDCRWTREFWRGNAGSFVRQHQACVRRRAVLSLLQNPACNDRWEGENRAQRVVDEVFDACFADTRPFEEIY